MTVARLVLGTAQIGLEKYGIANTTGKPSDEELEQMLMAARAHGVLWLDTAAAYGDAEERIGAFMKRTGVEFSIVTKMRPHSLDFGTWLVDDSVYEDVISTEIAASRDRLGRTPAVYLFHSASYAFDPRRLKALRNAVMSESVAMWGVSCYEPQEAHVAMECGVTALEVPHNLLDLRMLRAGVFDRAEASGVTVFARSPYTQGLLTAEPQQLDNPLLRERVERYHTAIYDHRECFKAFNALMSAEPKSYLAVTARTHRTPAYLALSSALSSTPTAYCVVGCETHQQVLQNVLYATAPSREAFAVLSPLLGGDTDPVVIPSLWAEKKCTAS